MPPSECMNSLFGVMRDHNGKPTGNFHRGVDLDRPWDGRCMRSHRAW